MADRPARPQEPPPLLPEVDEDRGRRSLTVLVLIVAVAAALIAAIVWVAPLDRDAGAEVLAGASVEGPLPVTVPYREIGGAIVVDVALDGGSETVGMILDTGAPTVVSEAAAAAFADDAVGTIEGTSIDGRPIISDIVRLPQVVIGDATFRNVGALLGTIEPGNPFYCITRSGLIGASLMQTAAWQIDPTAHTVTIAASADDLDIDGAVRYELTPSSDLSPSPLFGLPTGEGTLTLLLDTGSDGWLAAHPTDLDELGLPSPDDAPAQAILAAGAAGPFKTRARWLDAAITIGDEMIDLPVAALEAIPQGQGSAGSDFLRHFIVTLDWPGEALYLEPIGNPAPSTPSSAGLGWDGGYVVGSFVEGRPGHESLELGVSVSALDGQPVDDASFDDYCARVVRGEGPDTYEMTIDGALPTAVQVTPVEDLFE